MSNSPIEPEPNLNLQTDQALIFFRVLTPILLFITLIATFGSRAFVNFVWKLQNVGYDSVPTEQPSSYQINQHNNNNNRSNLNRNSQNPQLEVSSDGIIPVVIPIKRPRRALIYSFNTLIIITYFLDGLIICLRAVFEKVWEPQQVLAWIGLNWYVTSGMLLFVGCVIGMVMEERWNKEPGGWGKVYTKLFVGEAWLGEFMIACLVIKIFSQANYHSNALARNLGTYDLIHLILSLFRFFFITLLGLSHTPLFYYKVFIPLASSQNSTINSRSNYGTFNVSSESQSQLHSNNQDVLSTKAQIREPPKPAGILKLLKRVKILFPYLWPSKSLTLQAIALLCFICLLLGRGINLLVPMTLGEVVEDLTVGSTPWIHLGIFVGLRFLQGSGGIVNIVQQHLWIPISQFSDRGMSMMSFTHLLDLSLSYHTRRKTAEVLRILDRGSAINQFFQLLIFSLVPIFLDIALAVGYLAFRFDIILAAMLFLVMIAYVTASVILTQWRTAIRREMVDKDKYTRGIQGDSLLNWETIAWFNTKTFETSRYLGATIDYQRSEFLVMSSLYLLNMVQNAIIAIALLIGCFTVAFQVSMGTKTVGDFVLFVTYLAQLVGPLNQLGTLYRVIQQNLTDTDNLMKLLAEPKEIEDVPDAITVVNAKGEIEFDKVGFSYDGNTPALENISFKVPPGSSVALVGESGSGKSTLLRLLFRFYDPTSGVIKLDGQDIRKLTLASYRNQIGSVPQDAALFNDTIRYNIGYGAIGVKPNGPTMEDVVEAAKAAQIHNRIISFAEGYETRVGERGVRLSGGEKQRVAIARVMIRNPPVILLDEATSALDTTTEREIQVALQKLGQGRTTVAIAHRLSTIVHSDLILVMDKGKIVESGNHSNLLERKGIYSELWAKQIRAEGDAQRREQQTE
ncbi:hypothetical protein CROQUDRAFT_665076 [Cronartium quercuum f. sp. fusiforme G11]|uniref:Uncharacterized protein n=1 Tax=Cronartium quercuum f. sp. fusiforme G11 TaxID=708437 RepID=A0A9P6T6F5_9BASI|nr:hypothetical protein CROQUDRAFT_665076 [Cronartium quercuum f. sp. fusiforme G11]